MVSHTIFKKDFGVWSFTGDNRSIGKSVVMDLDDIVAVPVAVTSRHSDSIWMSLSNPFLGLLGRDNNFRKFTLLHPLPISTLIESTLHFRLR